MTSTYSRVYHSIVDDPKFATVYDDDRKLATWLRLLLVAEQAHPASAYIPAGTNRAAVLALSEAGLIDLGTGSRFRIHGLDAERQRRTEAARVAGLASGRSRAVQRTFNGRSTEGELERDETRRDEKIREEPPNPPPSGGLRASGTNPRAVAALAETAAKAEREERRRAGHALHQRYLRGELTEAQYDEAIRQLDRDPDAILRSVS